MKKIGITLLFVLATSVTFAQKFKNEKGNLSVLKGQNIVNIEFDYSNLKLFKKNLTEVEFVEKKKKEVYSKNKGGGELWESNWYSAKEVIWQPKFLELLSKYYKNIEFKENATDAKYTLIVEVVWIKTDSEHFSSRTSLVTTILKIVETANKSNVLYEVYSEKAQGVIYAKVFSSEAAIGEGFAKTAKSFAKYLTKEL